MTVTVTMPGALNSITNNDSGNDSNGNSEGIANLTDYPKRRMSRISEVRRFEASVRAACFGSLGCVFFRSFRKCRMCRISGAFVFRSFRKRRMFRNRRVCVFWAHETLLELLHEMLQDMRHR